MVQISALVVAAHSYGGLIADLLARTHPGMVSGLVLVDPTRNSCRRWAMPLEQIHQANTLLADALGTVNITTTDSGHNIMLYQPQLVAGQILATVNRVREG